ncbi:glycosyltransferase [Candidatus Parcubacteria bacterium]|nr:glycosyltransferase [Patescibacteria group bacterium]MBU4309256.1 glycosyltransferase [Patescibacteria group bacterium]MBU4432485.1 glycosyltransferase [Patescibacteria group bacterium]MBU4577617.1 glycosyltransferase [Patescibacteria group bacterium]MCG2697304.1 glycosyltransferase [Candidatus Parcubacteria bacterium]
MQEYWSKIANTYGLANYLEEIIRNDVASFILGQSKQSGSRVVELGCGNGRILKKISDKNSQIELTGVDTSEEMLQAARLEISASKLSLECGDVLGYLKKNNFPKFDFLVVCNTLHNLTGKKEIESVLRSSNNVLKDDGYFVFDVRNSFNPFISRGYRRSRAQGYSFFTFSYLKAIKILKQRGFEIVKVRPVQYQDIKQANKSQASFFKKILYSLYLKISSVSFFSPYILIYAKKTRQDFIFMIWGYHQQMRTLSANENYHLQALKAAKLLGYQVGILSIDARADIGNDFHKVGIVNNDIKMTAYANVWQFLKYLYKNRLSVIYVNTFTWQSFLVPFICRKAVFMGHDSVQRKTLLKQRIENFVFKFFKKIRVISDEEKDFLVKQGVNEKKIVVLPLAIDVQHFSRENIDGTRAGLIFLGNVTPDKNINTILRALAIVKATLLDIRLDVVGEVRDPEFDKLIKEHDLANVVKIHGFVAHDHLLPYLQKTKIYLNSSISEGQCLAAYEAALSGNALCLPATLSFSGVFKDKALFHSVYDHEKLAKNILYYLKNEQIMHEHNMKCREFISKIYTPELIMNKTQELFKL